MKRFVILVIGLVAGVCGARPGVLSAQVGSGSPAGPICGATVLALYNALTPSLGDEDLLEATRDMKQEMLDELDCLEVVKMARHKTSHLWTRVLADRREALEIRDDYRAAYNDYLNPRIRSLAVQKLTTLLNEDLSTIDEFLSLPSATGGGSRAPGRAQDPDPPVVVPPVNPFIGQPAPDPGASSRAAATGPVHTEGFAFWSLMELGGRRSVVISIEGDPVTWTGGLGEEVGLSGYVLSAIHRTGRWVELSPTDPSLGPVIPVPLQGAPGRRPPPGGWDRGPTSIGSPEAGGGRGSAAIRSAPDGGDRRSTGTPPPRTLGAPDPAPRDRTSPGVVYTFSDVFSVWEDDGSEAWFVTIDRQPGGSWEGRVGDEVPGTSWRVTAVDEGRITLTETGSGRRVDLERGVSVPVR